MTVLTTSTFWNTFLRTPNEASAKGTGTDSFVQYPCTAESHSDVPEVHVGRDKAGKVHTVFERPQSGILPRHTSAQHEGLLIDIFITAACHSLSAWAPLLLLLNTNLCTELKTASWAPDRELSAVFYYLQLKLAMNREIKINKLLCYYSLYVEQGKKTQYKPSVPFKMDLALYTVCESTQPQLCFTARYNSSESETWRIQQIIPVFPIHLAVLSAWEIRM